MAKTNKITLIIPEHAVNYFTVTNKGDNMPELNELVCTFEELIRKKIKDEKLIYLLRRKYFDQVFSEMELD